MSETVGEALREVELLRVRVPLVAPFRTARNVTTFKEALLVRVRVGDVTGWGECTAASTPEYDGETIDAARLALRDHLLPRVFAGAAYTDVRGNAAARAALECALLDARLRNDGISLASWLGAQRTLVDAGVAVGMTDDLDELRRVVGDHVAAGYRRIKCKIEHGHDVAVLEAARAEAGTSVQLAADANGSYTLDGARTLFRAIAGLGLQCVEQPCGAGAIAEHVALVEEFGTPVCLDETITSPEAAFDAITRDACAAVSIKVGRLGVSGSRAVHDTCVQHGAGALPGGLLETGVGRAALLAVAALPGFTLVGDVSASARYFGADGDLTEPFVLEAGKLQVPTGPGLGVSPLPERLAACTVARETIVAPR